MEIRDFFELEESMSYLDKISWILKISMMKKATHDYLSKNNIKIWDNINGQAAI
jgi:hypothetical protein